MTGAPAPVDVILMPAPTALLEDRLAREILSTEERETADRFVHERDALEYRASHALLRLVLAARLKRAPASLDILRAPCLQCGAAHGKPYLAEPLRFSFSRTGGLCGVAIAEHEVGLDVEAPIDPAAAREVAPALADDERRALDRSTAPGATATRIWVRKEAAVKCIGLGLGADLTSFSVMTSPATIARNTVWITDLPRLPEADASVASLTGAPDPHVATLTPEDVAELRAHWAPD